MSGPIPVVRRGERLLRVDQVAQRLDVSETTVRRLIADGLLPALRPSRRGYRVSEADLTRYMEVRRTGAGI